MQCFGGCWAQPSVQNDSVCGSLPGKTALPAGNVLSISGADGGKKAYLQSRTCLPNGFDSTPVAGKHTVRNSMRFAGIHGPKAESEVSTLSSSCSGHMQLEDKEQLLQQFLLQHGSHIMALSTLQQEGLQHFVVPGVGYIAYGLMHNGPEFLNVRTAVGLADPVCDMQHYRTITEAFLRAHPKAMFAQVSAEFATVLQDFGFTVNSMGGETRLDLATYNFTGYARRGLRSAIASAIKEGIVVEEVMHPPSDSMGGRAAGCAHTAAASASANWSGLVAEMQALDAKWAASKAGRVNEVWFINRRPIFAPEPGVRKFIARNAAGQLQGYIFFDGVFEQGRLVGYYANVTRMLPEAHQGTLNLLVKTFLERVRSESQMAAPAKKLSMRRSQRKKQQASITSVPEGSDAAAAAAAAADLAPKRDQDTRITAAAGPTGPSFLSLGLSPFHQMDNSGFKHCKVTHKLLQMTYDDGEGFYPFKTLAAAKAKYGAGLHDGKYEDAAVEYRQAYLCHRRGGAAMVSVFDLGKFFGLWKHPADFFSQYLGHKIKRSLKKQESSSLRKVKSSTCTSAESKSSATGPAASSVARSKSCPAATGNSTGAASSAAVDSGHCQQEQKKKKLAASADKSMFGLVAAGAGAAGAAAASGGAMPDSSGDGRQSLIGTAANPPGSACSEGGSDMLTCLTGFSSVASSSASPRCSTNGSTSPTKLSRSSYGV